MARPLASMFAFYTLTPGRRAYTLGGIRELAQARGLSTIVEAVDAAIAQERKALHLDAERLNASAPADVRAKDEVVDQTLLMIDNMLSYQGRKGIEAAVSLQATLFPGGATYHTRLPWVEQVAANERVLELLEGVDHAQWIDDHGLRALVVDLRRAHDAFEAALRSRDDPSTVTFAEVKQARAAGQELYLQVVVRILAEFLADPDTRDALMGPIWQQEEQVRAYRRQRRGALADVNPESGELLEADAGEAAPQAEPAANEA